MRFLISCLLCLFIFSPNAFAKVHTQEFLFDNGLKLLVTELPSSPKIAVYGYVKAGSVDEGVMLGSGLSHFLEHMLFKGTKKRGVGEIPAEIQSVGGYINAGTSYDFTIYTIDVPDTELEIGLDILEDMLFNATISLEEFKKEREVIMNEMRMVNDRPGRLHHRQIYRTLYRLHPYHHPIIGYPNMFEQITHNDLKRYYDERYIPNNIILSIAGNVDANEVYELVKDNFAKYDRGPEIIRNYPTEPQQIYQRDSIESYQGKLTRFTLAFPTVSLIDPDLYALDLLSMILGQGENSRLHKELFREQKIVSSISAFSYTPKDKGAFGVTATLNEEHDIDIVEEEVWKIINDIKRSGITSEELDLVIKEILSDQILQKQTAGSVARSTAMNEAFSGDYNFDEKYVERIQKVTNDDIKRVANKYLVEQNYNKIVSIPDEQYQPEMMAEQEELNLDLQKITLSNGIPLIYRYDPTFPVISINVVANGGQRYETEENQGLFKLLSNLWLKETRKYSQEELANLTQGQGIYLSAFSGKNSFGLNAEFLEDEYDQALDLLRELLLFPTFPEKEIELIKKQLLTSQISQKESIGFLTVDRMKKELLSSDHSLAFNEIGTTESIEKIDRKQIINLFKQLINNENIAISAFGNIELAKVKDDLEKIFDQIPIEDFRVSPPKEPTFLPATTVDQDFPKEQSMVLISFPSVDLKHPDFEAINVLKSVLGSSFSGRLFKKIRDENGLAYSTRGSISTTLDGGIIFFYALTDQENLDKVEEMMRIEINRLKKGLVSEEELNTIKRYIIGTAKMSLEKNSAVGMTSALNELYGLGYDYHESLADRVNAVTAEEVMNMAKKYFDFNKAVIVKTNSTITK